MTILSWALLSGFTVLLPGQEPLEIRAAPRATFEPATIRITAMVEPHEANRTLTIVVDAAAYRSRTRVPLEGADEPRAHHVIVKAIPAGDYLIEARVDRNDGTTLIETTTVTVRK